ncbi:hypothetical protein QCA50_012106 [Cerrena zonata]|uniref:Succinate dehydrogenase assembly factor 4, mitochondrial n=1 Tax=Cerrena zonata TaxID=2478898 RepID=A0AAW0FZY1_9APHY
MFRIRPAIKPTIAARGISSSAARFSGNKFGTDFTPSPPKLPKEQQEEFEKLQRIANSQAAIEEFNKQNAESGLVSSNLAGDVEAQQMKTDIGRFNQYFKTVPEFEGDVNPATGERGGPKQDPLKHGNDWSFNVLQ